MQVVLFDKGNIVQTAENWLQLFFVWGVEGYTEFTGGLSKMGGWHKGVGSNFLGEGGNKSLNQSQFSPIFKGTII